MTFVWIALALVALEAAIILWCVAEERPFSGFFSVALVLLVVSWLLNWNLWELVSANPLWVVGGFSVYIVAGVASSLGEWGFYVRKIRDLYLDSRKKHGITDETPEPNVDAFLRLRNAEWECQSIPPLASENKNRILTWMMYWPPSLLWRLINDPVRKAFQFIFEQLKSLYQGISDSAFEDLDS